MEQHKPEQPDPSRRSFLRAAGGAGALGALAVAAGGAAEAAPVPAPEAEAAGPKGYRETEHILKYYRTARYW
jgi:hypothetical protein